jgi:antitoxin MazE6
MKTAVSLPNETYESAEKLAKRLGKSRSELYADAINDYLSRNSTKLVKESLDKIYSENDSQLDPAIAAMQLETLSKEQW